MTERMANVLDDECLSCGEEVEDKCPASKRECGHHCNHAWSHEICCWCGEKFGPIEESPATRRAEEAEAYAGELREAATALLSATPFRLPEHDEPERYVEARRALLSVVRKTPPTALEQQRERDEKIQEGLTTLIREKGALLHQIQELKAERERIRREAAMECIKIATEIEAPWRDVVGGASVFMVTQAIRQHFGLTEQPAQEGRGDA